jgi:Na+/melibiose symporter-like transporter
MCTSNIWWAGRLNDIQIKYMTPVIEACTLFLSLIIIIALSVTADICRHKNNKGWYCIFNIVVLVTMIVFYICYMLFRYRIYRTKKRYGYNDINDDDFSFQNDAFIIEDADDIFYEYDDHDDHDGSIDV